MSVVFMPDGATSSSCPPTVLLDLLGVSTMSTEQDLAVSSVHAVHVEGADGEIYS